MVSSSIPTCSGYGMILVLGLSLLTSSTMLWSGFSAHAGSGRCGQPTSYGIGASPLECMFKTEEGGGVWKDHAYHIRKPLRVLQSSSVSSFSSTTTPSEGQCPQSLEHTSKLMHNRLSNRLIRSLYNTDEAILPQMSATCFFKAPAPTV